jgi:hypothetical protein
MDKRLSQRVADRFLAFGVKNTRWGGISDKFAAFWNGLEDPWTGNAGLRDFHELRVIDLCTVLSGGQGAVDMALFAKAKEASCRVS